MRSVWRLTRPLASSWNIFNPSRDKIALQHWGVVVANFDKQDLEKRISESQKRSSTKEHWGEIHQLRKEGNLVRYDFREWTSDDVEKKTVMTYVGNTTMSDNEIMDKGIICRVDLM